jgi:hypothetical protein
MTIVMNFLQAQDPAEAVGAEPGWRKIGEGTADFRNSNESVVQFSAEKFKALKFRVTDAAITFERGTIYYDNGDQEDLFINREMGKDEETRPFGLRRPPEKSSKVSFKYKVMPNYRHETAHVEIFGLK